MSLISNNDLAQLDKTEHVAMDLATTLREFLDIEGTALVLMFTGSDKTWLSITWGEGQELILQSYPIEYLNPKHLRIKAR